MSALDEAVSLLEDACRHANDGDPSPFSAAARSYVEAPIELAAAALDEVLARPEYGADGDYGRRLTARDLEVLDDARQLLQQLANQEVRT